MKQKQMHPAAAALLALALTLNLPSLSVAFASTGGYDKCLEFSVVGYVGESALENFPMLVRLSPGIDGFSYADFKSSGADLRFALADGTELDHGIEMWNPAGTSYVWVRIPSLVNGLRLKMYFGKAGDVAPDANPFGSSGYWSVLHFGETDEEYAAAGNVYADASGNGHTAEKAPATVTGVVYTPSSVEGIIGNAVKLDESLPQNEKGPSVRIPKSIYGTRTFTDTFSVSGWFRYENSGQSIGEDVIFGCRQFRLSSVWNTPKQMYLLDPGCNWNVVNLGAILSSGLNDGSWHHIAATFCGTDYRIYENGVLVKSGTLKSAMVKENFAFGIGNNEDNSRPSFKGCVDDVRIAGSALAADWFAAEYAQAKPGAKFLSLDFRKVHVVPSGTPGVVSAEPYDAWDNAATDIEAALAFASAQGADVVVRPGTYALTNPVEISDGVVVASERASDGLPDADGTVIDASAISSANAVSVGIGAVLRGFTIKGASASGSETGGALYLAGGEASVGTVVDSCIFTNNTAKYGAAIYQASGFKGVVTNCQFLANGANSGGGVYIGGTASGFGTRPLYVDCVFRGNEANIAWGNGPAVYGGGTVFERCTFDGNAQVGGGHTSAIYGGDYLQINDCLFRNHDATSDGASCLYNMGKSSVSGSVFTANGGNRTYGVVSWSSLECAIENCIFTNNTQSVVAGRVNLRNCLIADNGVGKDDAGVALTKVAGYSRIENCTICGNNYGIFAGFDDAHAVVVNSIITGNDPGHNYDFATWKRCWLYATNSIVQKCTYHADDPRECHNLWNTGIDSVGFVNPGNGDYHLKKSAFARDMGVVLPWMDSSAVDLEGNPRISKGEAPDLGCYEFQVVPGFSIFVR